MRDVRVKEFALAMTTGKHSGETPGLSPDLLQTVFDSMSDGVVIFDENGLIETCNYAMGVLVDRAIEDMIGLSPEEAWGGNNELEASAATATKTRHPLFRADGSKREVSIRVFRLPAPDRRVVAVYRDMTRNQRESDEFFRFLFENGNDGILISQGERILYANKRLGRILGYSMGALLQKTKSELRNSDAKVTCSDAALETTLKRADEGEITVETEMTSGVFRGESVTFEIFRDISERKRNERRAEAFLRLGEKLNTVTSSVEAARVVVGVADDLIGWDACFIDILDANDPTHVIPTLYMDTMNGRRQEVEPPPADQKAVYSSLQRITKGPRLILRTPEEDFKPKTYFGDQSRASMSLMFAPIANKDQVVGVISLQSYTAHAYSEDDLETLAALAGYCSSALSRSHAQAALTESELRYRYMFEKNSAVKLVIDSESGAIVDANPAACSYYGYSREYLTRMSFFHLTVSSTESMLSHLSSAFTEESGRFETRQRISNGQVRDVDVYLSPLVIKQRHLLHVIVQDVTDRKRAEERSQAFAELGKRLSSSTNPREAARSVVEIADRLIGWDACFLDLFAGDVEQRVLPEHLLVPILHIDTIDGARVEVEPVGTILPAGSATLQTLEKGSTLILRQPGSRHTFSLFGDKQRPSASLMYVPIHGTMGVVGVLSIQSYNFDNYDNEDLATLQLLADHCGGALERTRAEEQVRLLESAVRYASDMVMITVSDPSSETGSRIVFVNDAVEKCTGYTRDELIGKSTRILQGPDTNREALEKMKIALLAQKTTTVELVNYRKDGTAYDVEFSAFPISDAQGKFRYFVSVQRDITDRKQAEQQLIYRAFHDSLTALPNRNLFRERVEHAILRTQRCDETFGVLFIDLDNFKNVNDEFGHAAGDHVLQCVARRLETCVRPGDTVARRGGDEFTVLLEGIATLDDATHVAERILQVLSEPLHWEEHFLKCCGSVGLAMHSVQYTSPEEIVRDADQALYVAKNRGKACYVVFNQSAEYRRQT